MAKAAPTKSQTKKASAGKVRAFGRSLEDFGELNTAEKEVLAAAREGRVALFGTKVPETDADKKTRTVRAGLVRFLALGGDDANPVHEQGVLVRGAVIDGTLDFEGCTLGGDLTLTSCRLNDTLTLRGARTKTIDLSNSHCSAIMAERLNVGGTVFLKNGFVATGIVKLHRAKINGDLDCQNGRFEGRDENGEALDCDGIEVEGYVFLRRASTNNGAARFLNAKIGASFECDGSRFEGQNKIGYSLNCERIDVRVYLFLRNGFTASGIVRLFGAKAADVLCSKGTFGTSLNKSADRLNSDDPPRHSDITSPLVVLDLSRMTVSGTLFLSEPGPSKALFYGGVSLVAAHIDRIVDSIVESTRYELTGTFDQGRGSPAFFRLDGLVYDRFGASTDLTAKARIAFLRLQKPDDLGTTFKPQPWTQMIKVLRESGHTEAAREVAIEFEEQRRRAGVIQSWVGRALHIAYGWLVGYGHKPMHLMRIAASVWLIWGAIYFAAAEIGVMAPSNPLVFDADEYAGCRPGRGGNWTACDTTPYEYSTFNPWIYSLDLILPLVDLLQERDWSPMMQQPCVSTIDLWVTKFCWISAAHANADEKKVVVPKPAYWFAGVFVWIFMWVEILFGWIASLLLVAVFSGLTKRMDGG